MGPECAPTQGPDDPSAPPDEDFTSRFTTAISRISRRIRVTSFTMTYGALSALATIDRSGPLRPAELADIERVTRPSITRIVAALESRGYISRTDDPTTAGPSSWPSPPPAGRRSSRRAPSGPVISPA